MKKYILDFETLNEMVDGVLGDLNIVYLTITGDHKFLSNKVFSKNLKHTLKRVSHKIDLLRENRNKLYFRILVDRNEYKILTDLANDIKRELDLNIKNYNGNNIDVETNTNDIIVTIK